MLKNKIKYILALFIILSLSMNAFSATDFTDDSSAATPQSSSVDEVVGDGADSQDNKENDNSDNTNTNDNKQGKSSFGGNGSSFNFNGSSFGGNGSGFNFNGSSFGGNGSGFNFGNTSFGGNGSSSFNFNRSGSNSSDFDIASILDYFMKMLGGDNATNTTNETVNPEVSDVPEVVTSTSYAPVSQSPGVEVQSSHVIQRLRDNKTISEGNTLALDGLNKLFDSDFTNGHLLVYIDGKLVFNEITAGDLSTPIFQITDDYIGQHQITVEFTPDGNSNTTNKYTEDVLII